MDELLEQLSDFKGVISIPKFRFVRLLQEILLAEKDKRGLDIDSIEVEGILAAQVLFLHHYSASSFELIFIYLFSARLRELLDRHVQVWWDVLQARQAFDAETERYQTGQPAVRAIV
jgi:hypothetical protein